MDSREIIERLGLEPHPEGGWYRETWRAPATRGERPSGSAIYYLLGEKEESRRHRVDATELWHHYGGAPLALALGEPETTALHVLGPDLALGQWPQVAVLPWTWQSARSLGAYTLVGCTVSPAFQFEGFELAEP